MGTGRPCQGGRGASYKSTDTRRVDRHAEFWSALLRPLSSPSVSPWYSIYSKSQQRVRFRLKLLFGSKAFPEARGVAMRKTPLALNTSDFWKLNY
jgi:hypothetical protein